MAYISIVPVLKTNSWRLLGKIVVVQGVRKGEKCEIMIFTGVDILRVISIRTGDVMAGGKWACAVGLDVGDNRIDDYYCIAIRFLAPAFAKAFVDFCDI